MSCLHQPQFMKCIYLFYISFLFLMDENFSLSQEGNYVNIKKLLNVHFKNKTHFKICRKLCECIIAFIKGHNLLFLSGRIPRYPKADVYCATFLCDIASL